MVMGMNILEINSNYYKEIDLNPLRMALSGLISSIWKMIICLLMDTLTITITLD